ncbi:hypothetical protein BGZ83_005868 [Gryganskiella cystojenkinii]|nr:hypothetical protein BGZ83_005868 [Gryganskiella cystojenkinii]
MLEYDGWSPCLKAIKMASYRLNKDEMWTLGRFHQLQELRIAIQHNPVFQMIVEAKLQQRQLLQQHSQNLVMISNLKEGYYCTGRKDKLWRNHPITQFVLASTYSETPVRLMLFRQENRPEELKAAIAAEFQRRGEPPIFCESSNDVTVIVFESFDKNWYKTARTVRHDFNTNNFPIDDQVDLRKVTSSLFTKASQTADVG